MSYRIVYPVAMPIDANDFRDAVKKFIKLNHFMNIEQLILTDQYNHMRANVKYYDADRRRKASIQLIPMDAAAVAAFPGVVGFPGVTGVTGFSSTNPKAPYPAFAVGPSMIGGPAGIIAPSGPMIGPMIGIPGGSGVAGVIYGARSGASEEIIRIDEINSKLTAITKDGSTFPILKIQKINNNQCRIIGPGGRTLMITTEIEDGDRIVFINKKIKPDDDETMFDLTDVINKYSSTPTSVPAPSSSAMTIGPTSIITPNKQIVQVAPVQPIGTDGRPVRGVAVPFGVSGVSPRIVPTVSPRFVPAVARAGIIGMRGVPGVAVGGPVIGTPVDFGRGVY
jgi:hypothetical protein